MTPQRLLLAALACTFALAAGVRAQPAGRLPMVAILAPGGPVSCDSQAQGFPAACMVEGLRALGWVEGRNVVIEVRHAHGDFKRLTALAVEMAALRPEVIYTHTSAGADAAAKATSTIPVVVGVASDVTLTRLAGNLARPAGNVTGYALSLSEQGTVEKCLELLKELAPRTTRVALVFNPDNRSFVPSLGELQPAATRLGLSLLRADARSAAELPQAVSAAVAGGANAIFLTTELWVGGTPESRRRFAELALRHRLASASANIRFAADGGLVSLGPDLGAIGRRSARHVDRILRGARPGDLPIERPTEFKLTINRGTAKALGLTIPQGLLLRADEVVE